MPKKLMKSVPFTLAVVGYFGLAVSDPRESSKWWAKAVGLKELFKFDEGVAIGNDNVTIALHKGNPFLKPSGTCHSTCRASGLYEKHWRISRRSASKSKIPVMRLAQRRLALKTWVSGFTTPTVIAGN